MARLATRTQLAKTTAIVSDRLACSLVTVDPYETPRAFGFRNAFTSVKVFSQVPSDSEGSGPPRRRPGSVPAYAGFTLKLALVRDVLERDVEQESDVRVVEGVVDVSALLAIPDEAARAQEAQVVRAGRLGQSGRSGEIADAELSAFEESDDQANTARIGKDAERLRKLLARAVVGQGRNDVGDPLGIDALDLAAIERDDVHRLGTHLAHRSESAAMISSRL